MSAKVNFIFFFFDKPKKNYPSLVDFFVRKGFLYISKN